MELKRYKLGDCLTMIENGAVIKQKKNATGIPITRIETLSNDRFNRDRLGYADIANVEQYSHYILDDKDLIMSHINSRAFLGRTVLYRKQEDEQIIHGMNVLRIKTNEQQLNAIYAYYYFKTSAFRIAIDRIRKDAINQSSLAISDIKNIDIFIPSIEDQNQIALVLNNLDSKIQLKEAINQNLEALAKQLYDYWFVQFDFPDENGKPYKSSGGKMVWNEKLKREIPEGWNTIDLSMYLNTYVEKVSPKTINCNEKYAPIEVLPKKKMSFSECSPIENAVSGLCRFQKKHILLSNRRVYFHKVCIAAFNGITRDTVIVLMPISESYLGYAYQLVNDDRFIEYATRHSYGSEQPVLSWESAKLYKVLEPSNQLDKIYSNHISSIIENVLRNEMEIDALIKQRDELLPLLMNGQVSAMFNLCVDDESEITKIV